MQLLSLPNFDYYYFQVEIFVLLRTEICDYINRRLQFGNIGTQRFVWFGVYVYEIVADIKRFDFAIEKKKSFKTKFDSQYFF